MAPTSIFQMFDIEGRSYYVRQNDSSQYDVHAGHLYSDQIFTTYLDPHYVVVVSSDQRVTTAFIRKEVFGPNDFKRSALAVFKSTVSKSQ